MTRARFRSIPAITALAILVSCGGGGRTGAGMPAPSRTGPTRPSPLPSATGVTGSDDPAPQGSGTRARAAVPAPKSTTRATPAEPGVYRYRQSGETVFGAFRMPADPEGTLEVRAASGNLQTGIRTYADNRSREQTARFSGALVELTDAVERIGSGPAAQEIRCTPDEPLTIVQLPLMPGRAWSDDAECDGVTISIRSSVLRTERRDVDGRSIETAVLRTNLRISGGGYDQTGSATTWIAPAYRLIVRSVERAQGTFQGQPYSRELTEDLVSLAPER